MEIIACDATCANFRASEIALVVICAQMDTGVAQLEPQPCGADVLALVSFASQLQQLCKVNTMIKYVSFKKNKYLRQFYYFMLHIFKISLFEKVF